MLAAERVGAGRKRWKSGRTFAVVGGRRHRASGSASPQAGRRTGRTEGRHWRCWTEERSRLPGDRR